MPSSQALVNGSKDFSELMGLHPVLTLVISLISLRWDDKQDCLFRRFTGISAIEGKTCDHVIDYLWDLFLKQELTAAVLAFLSPSGSRAGVDEAGKASGSQNAYRHIDFLKMKSQVKAKLMIVVLTISSNCHSRCVFDNNYNVMDICARICIYSSNSTNVYPPKPRKWTH